MGNMLRVISMYLISSGALRIWSLRPSESLGKNRHIQKEFTEVRQAAFVPASRTTQRTEVKTL